MKLRTTRSGDTLQSVAEDHSITVDDLVQFNCGCNETKARRTWLHDIVGCRIVTTDDEPVLDDLDRPGIIHVPTPLALKLATETNHLIRAAPAERGYAIHQPPVYMVILERGATVLSEPDHAAGHVGALSEGTLIRVLEEVQSEQECFVRFHVVARKDDDLYYYFRPIPQGQDTWISLHDSGALTAQYADIGAMSNELEDDDLPMFNVSLEDA